MWSISRELGNGTIYVWHHGKSYKQWVYQKRKLSCGLNTLRISLQSKFPHSLGRSALEIMKIEEVCGRLHHRIQRSNRRFDSPRLHFTQTGRISEETKSKTGSRWIHCHIRFCWKFLVFCSSTYDIPINSILYFKMPFWLMFLQDAVQGWHWPNAQCTIHPFSIYFKDANDAL